MSLGIDYAWRHPDPSKIRAAGYDFVLRYLSTDPTKNLSADEVTALHNAGLNVGLVWETTSTRATAGYPAGRDDRLAAERQANALRYPKNCPIFWACDEDVDPAKVNAYARGWYDTAGALSNPHPTGVYGSYNVVEGTRRLHLAWYGWQTEAWSGTQVSNLADLYQRVKPTRPAIAGCAGDYDEDVLIHEVPLWEPPVLSPKAEPSSKPAKPRWLAWRYWFKPWF